MSNTYDFGSVCQTLSKRGTTILQDRLAPLAGFCTALPLQKEDVNPAFPRVVSLATVAATTQKNPTDFSPGNSTLAALTIPHDLYVQPFGLGEKEYSSGARLEWLADLNARAFADAISDAVLSLCTTANFGAAAVTADAAAFTVASFETLIATVPSESRAVVLDSPYFVKVKPATWLPPGPIAVFECSRFSAAGSQVHGLVADRRAIVLSYGVPQLTTMARQVMARDLIQLPQLGIMVETVTWLQLPTRTVVAAYAVYLGAQVGDANALQLLCSTS
jgi:hypothetical protein